MSEALPKFLCVDDEPSIVEALERMFKSHFQVFPETKPEVALSTLRLHPDCAVVLSDFQMPIMNGVDFLRQARTIAPLSSRAILSGHIDLQQISLAINHADIHKFILKPWENDYLRLQMLEALQTHITLRERAHYERLSVTDPVTGLTNHRFFQDRWREELEKAKNNGTPLALVVIDVDHFKQFNDRYGHPEGDFLLHTVAERLKAHSTTDGLVSRYGGEEFTLILPGRNSSEAEQVAQTIRLSFERTPFTGPMSSRAYITISAGVAAYPEHGSEAAELIETADRSMYQAKRQGRNQVAVAAAKAR